LSADFDDGGGANTIDVEYGLETWDYQWQLAHYANRLLVIRPRSNLVANRGDGRDATHTFTVDRACVATQDIDLPLVHPRSICWDRKADVRLERAHVNAWMPVEARRSWHSR